MNPIKYIHIIIVIYCLLPDAQAQKSWTLNECIRYAHLHNLSQHQYQLGEKSVKVLAWQSKLNLLPSVHASSSAGISYGRSVDPSSNDVTNIDFFTTSFGINASLTLFQGFILQNKIGYAKYQQEAQKWTRIYHSDDLAFNVMIAYYDLIYFEGLTSIVKEQLKVLDFNVRKISKMIETGLKSKSDLIEIQASQEKEVLTLLETSNKAESCRLKLAKYLNLPVVDSIEVADASADTLIVFGCPDPDSLFLKYVEQSTYVKIAEANLRAASKQVAIARGNYLPSISLNASVGSSYSETEEDNEGAVIPFRTQMNNNLGEYIGASLSVPVFGKNQVRSAVKIARLQKEQANAELESYRQTVYYELMNNSRELSSLHQQYLQTSKQYEAEEQAYRLAQRKYDEGIMNVVDLLIVKNRLAGAKASQLSAKLQLIIKQRTIEFYKGNRFWEN